MNKFENIDSIKDLESEWNEIINYLIHLNKNDLKARLYINESWAIWFDTINWWNRFHIISYENFWIKIYRKLGFKDTIEKELDFTDIDLEILKNLKKYQDNEIEFYQIEWIINKTYFSDNFLEENIKATKDEANKIL